MALMKWKPLPELSNMRRQIDRLMYPYSGLEDFTKDLWTPDVNVTETEDEIVVSADIPGIFEKDMSIKLSGDNLILKGERKEENGTKGKHFHKIERACGSFSRTIPIPVGVDTGKIVAGCNNGVLEFHLPKKEEAKAKERLICRKKLI